ncbi:FecR domain-containing protein [Hymenobacter sp. BT188]|uniref:FecR family protein n=1 Tax=Hymenobacter sp. BT188 TaxID=2763504 RepID=UPI0016516462|nr:FecR domain-containing protein [Hymenobacter sp. BT188]MBC6608802.1 FecR domain-containing protein [Hymenobacter sp. BT188]
MQYRRLVKEAPTMTPQQRRLFFQKFAANQHTPAEHQAFLRWLGQASGPELEDALTEYEQLPAAADEAAPPPRLLAGIEARLHKVPAKPAVAAKRPWSGRMWAAAAVIGLLLFVGGHYLLLPSSTPTPALVYLHKRVPAGQIDSLTLPDGSRIVLNAGSTLTYPTKFAANRRDVSLEGEAYFRVAKNPAQPFVVHSGSLQTWVVGTSFNIYAYARAARQEVTVLTGAVSVRDAASQQHVALQPAQRAVFERTTRKLRKVRIAKPGLSLAWQRGQLRFEDAPLEEVLDKLSTRHGVLIRPRARRLDNCRLTVHFEDETLPEVLQVLGALTRSRPFTDDQRIIWLEGQGCP